MTRMPHSCSMKTPSYLANALVLLGALALLLAGRQAFAQSSGSAQISASAQLSHRTQYVNTDIELQVIVTGTDNASVPATPEIPGVDVEFITSSPRSSRSISIINGRRRDVISESISFLYRLTPREEGAFQVPRFTINADGRELTTQAQSFRAILPDRPEEFTLVATVDRDEVFVGEPVELRLVWYVGLEVDSASFERNRPPDGARILPRKDPGYNPMNRSGNLQAFPIFEDATTAELGTGELNGRRYTTVTIDATIIPTKAGQITLGPWGVDFDYLKPGERRMSRGESVAAGITIRANPLPTQGRPASFTGLMGPHAITASLNRREVSVGDPMTLRVEITSANPYSLIEDGPDLEAVSGLAGSFRIDSTGWKQESGSGPGRWVFSRTVRVSTEAATEFPSIPLAWFDPASGSYQVAESPPLPLVVRPTTVITAADAVGLSNAASPSLLTRSSPGIWALHPSPLATASPATRPGSSLGTSAGSGSRSVTPLGFTLDTDGVLIAILITPPLVVVVAASASWARRRRDPRSATIRSANARALRTISRAGTTSELASGLVRFAANVQGLDADCSCSQDLRALAERLNVAIPTPISEILRAPEHARYGAIQPHGPVPDGQLRAMATELVRAIAARERTAA